MHNFSDRKINADLHTRTTGSMDSLLGRSRGVGESGKGVGSYEEFVQCFPYPGDTIYKLIFELCGSSIKTKKQRFAVANLQTIFESMFKICSQSSFHAMSLRNLCDATGISMGGLYSCIKDKYQLLIMVKSLVRFLSDDLHRVALSIEAPNDRLEWFIRNNIYMTTLLQPWFFFLYVETHSLEGPDQMESKAIELDTITRVMDILEQGNKLDEFNVVDTWAVATILFSMEQEWYMKPWKYRGKGISVDQYVDTMLRSTNILVQAPEKPSLRVI